jgi:hypothetical protein
MLTWFSQRLVCRMETHSYFLIHALLLLHGCCVWWSQVGAENNFGGWIFWWVKSSQLVCTYNQPNILKPCIGFKNLVNYLFGCTSWDADYPTNSTPNSIYKEVKCKGYIAPLWEILTHKSGITVPRVQKNNALIINRTSSLWTRLKSHCKQCN